ncbi:MAG: RNA ligase (ATP) [Lachnospiraceae bacterium]|nr:RNA ligase (ATP) [Lachnospiraceae bacterium]
MANRKLASVQMVHHVNAIEGADRIECVQVLGWNVVAKKGEFRVGDYCVYFEVDSFLPVCEQFEFLRSSCFKNDDYMGQGFRLKTQRFRGQISQGLILPTDILPQDREYVLGEDVTELLGVRKWDIEEKVTGSGTVIGEMPFGIPKTDEMRIQSFPELITEFKKVPSYYISTKMDGTSVTMYWKKEESGWRFGVCGRNYEYADDGKCAFWEYAKKNRIEEKLREKNLPELAIQGEFCGGGIQKNRLKLKFPEWYVFTVIDLQTHRRLSLEKMTELCTVLGLHQVPVEETGEVFPYHTVDELLERARGKYASGMHKEGIVIRPTEPVFSYTLSGPLSMKVLNNDYLLKE